MCGDFNTVPNSQMDSTTAPSKRTPSLANFLRSHELYDAWRCTHANERHYSFSHRHCTYTRIDLLILVAPKGNPNQNLHNNMVRPCSYSPHPHSTHTLTPLPIYGALTRKLYKTPTLRKPWRTACPITSRSFPLPPIMHFYYGMPTKHT